MIAQVGCGVRGAGLCGVRGAKNLTSYILHLKFLNGEMRGFYHIVTAFFLTHSHIGVRGARA